MSTFYELTSHLAQYRYLTDKQNISATLRVEFELTREDPIGFQFSVLKKKELRSSFGFLY